MISVAHDQLARGAVSSSAVGKAGPALGKAGHAPDTVKAPRGERRVARWRASRPSHGPLELALGQRTNRALDDEGLGFEQLVAVPAQAAGNSMRCSARERVRAARAGVERSRLSIGYPRKVGQPITPSRPVARAGHHVAVGVLHRRGTTSLAGEPVDVNRTSRDQQVRLAHARDGLVDRHCSDIPGVPRRCLGNLACVAVDGFVNDDRAHSSHELVDGR